MISGKWLIFQRSPLITNHSPLITNYGFIQLLPPRIFRSEYRSHSLGGNNPIRIQSMTNTVTMDTEACVEQAKRIIDAGGEYVRLTTQGVREAENLKNINIGLRSQGYDTPLVADVHFNPKVADVAAQYAEKVRINPGNYVDPGRTFRKLEYTDEEYAQEIEKIRARFIPFLNICKENHTAIRIGVNHGSLSDRIMSHYGDTLKVWWNRAWNFCVSVLRNISTMWLFPSKHPIP